MSRFHTTYKDIFGEDYKAETYKMVDHSFVFSKKAGKSICTRCGLLAINNEGGMVVPYPMVN